MIAFRLSAVGDLLDFVDFPAQHPEINLIANKFYGNYQGELFQIALVSDELKKEKIVKENDELQFCKNGHML